MFIVNTAGIDQCVIAVVAQDKANLLFHINTN